jgi:hypothetical protein
LGNRPTLMDYTFKAAEIVRDVLDSKNHTKGLVSTNENLHIRMVSKQDIL